MPLRSAYWETTTGPGESERDGIPTYIGKAGRMTKKLPRRRHKGAKICRGGLDQSGGSLASIERAAGRTMWQNVNRETLNFLP